METEINNLPADLFAKSAVISFKNRYCLFILSDAAAVVYNFEPLELVSPCVFALWPGETLIVPHNVKARMLTFTDSQFFNHTHHFKKIFANPRKPLIFNGSAPYSLKGDYEFFAHQLYQYLSTHIEANSNLWSVDDLSDTQLLALFKSLDFEETTHQIIEIVNFVWLVNKYYKLEHRMPFYADMMRTSAKNITRTFLESGNSNPHSFIKNRLLAEAKRQLVFTDELIGSVGYELGFSEPAYFARFFKKNSGSRAGHFRKIWQLRLKYCSPHRQQAAIDK